MSNSSKSNLVDKIKSEYNNKLKDLEVKLATARAELKKINNVFTHETKRVSHLNLSKLKVKRAELNSNIVQLKKEITKVSKEKFKKLKKL